MKRSSEGVREDRPPRRQEGAAPWPEELHTFPPQAESAVRGRKKFLFVKLSPALAAKVTGVDESRVEEHILSALAGGPAPGGIIHFRSVCFAIVSRAAADQGHFEGKVERIGAIYLFEGKVPAIKQPVAPAGETSLWA